MKLTHNALLLIATIIITLYMGITYHQQKVIHTYKDMMEKTHTTTTVKHDTIYNTQVITDTVPTLKYRYVTKVDTVYKQNDSIPHALTLENKTFQDTLRTNDDTIAYKAFISGYSLDNDSFPRLDSINLSRTFKTITVYKETIIEKQTPQKQRKWHLQPSVGIGYGVINKNADVFLGVSFGYELW